MADSALATELAKAVAADQPSAALAATEEEQQKQQQAAAAEQASSPPLPPGEGRGEGAPEKTSNAGPSAPSP
jgi:hypothetical protein